MNAHVPDLSPIEQIYDRNVASVKLRHGTKYEQLAALVFQVLDADSTVTHDVKLRGDGKETVHQIDVVVTREERSERTVIECRDKADPNKVDLDEARSFATVVRQLDCNGIMVTTTDYTSGALSLAMDEGITLLTLRPFLDSDMEGRLMRLEATLRAITPVPDAVRVEAPSHSDLKDGEVTLPLDAAIVEGSPAATLRHLLASLMDAPLEGPIPQGPQSTIREFDPAVVIDVPGPRLEIARIQVDYHVEEMETTFRVDAGDRVAELLLQSVGGDVDRVIWDGDLQRYIVSSAGRVVQRLMAPKGSAS
jgi:hypothetical protein